MVRLRFLQWQMMVGEGGPMKLNTFCAVAVLLVAYAPSVAMAYCSEPSAPSFYGTAPTEPNKPYCINEYSNTHTCSDWEIRSYNSDIDRYNDDLRRYRVDVDSYVRQLQDYVDGAVDYAKCEIGNL